MEGSRGILSERRNTVDAGVDERVPVGAASADGLGVGEESRPEEEQGLHFYNQYLYKKRIKSQCFNIL